MALSSPYDPNTGLPKDGGYLERDLPDWRQESIEPMKNAWKRVDSGEEYPVGTATTAIYRPILPMPK